MKCGEHKNQLPKLTRSSSFRVDENKYFCQLATGRRPEPTFRDSLKGLERGGKTKLLLTVPICTTSTIIEFNKRK